MRYLPRNEAGEIKNKNALRIVAMFEHKNKACVVTRDKWGKFRVVVDDPKGKAKSEAYNLTAVGIVRYMANMLHGGK